MMIGSAILLLSFFLLSGLRIIQVMRWRDIDQTLTMRCLGACSSENLELHLQGTVNQSNLFHGSLHAGEIEIQLKNIKMTPNTLFPDSEYQYWNLDSSRGSPDLKMVMNRSLTQWFLFDSKRSFLILPADFNLNELDKVENAAGVRIRLNP